MSIPYADIVCGRYPNVAPLFRNSDNLQPPTGHLRGVFSASSSSSSWQASREHHLELAGPILTVSSDREGTNIFMRQDVRDIEFRLGTRPRELIFTHSTGSTLSLTARHLTTLATWMEALVEVVESGCVAKYYKFALGIGCGKRGPVRLAWDKTAPASSSPVVVKEVRIDERGVKALCDLDLAQVCRDHENLLTVLDVFQTMTREYIVSDYARGGSLEDVILQGRSNSPENIEGLGSMGDWAIDNRFSEDDVRVIILELAKGLEVRHASRTHVAPSIFIIRCECTN
jgi:hypothetical protein